MVIGFLTMVGQNGKATLTVKGDHMRDYSSMFTKKTRRRGETSQLLETLEKAVLEDLNQVLSSSRDNISVAMSELIQINLKFNEAFLRIRWADGFSSMEHIRYELADIQRLIDGTRADLRTLASVYMNENNNAM